MTSHFLMIFGFSLLVFALHVNGDPEDVVSFDQNYFPLWGATHLTRVDNDRGVQLLLDQSSGSGFRSKLDYGSGRFGIRMKLPEANTSGIIISFYLSSAPDGPHSPGNHDEIDFEFIGGPVLQTNVFAGDSGNREERYSLWFDPRTDFHLYEFLWNPNIVVFYVDGVPVRVFKNNIGKGVNYLSHPMHIEGSIWTGAWAGAVDWAEAPFISGYRRFGIDGCVSPTTSLIPQCVAPNLPWNIQKELNPQELMMYQNFRKVHMIYDYCSDRTRRQIHPECLVPPV